MMESYFRSSSYKSQSASSSYRLEKKAIKDSKKIVTSQETTIDDFQGSIDNWEIPRVHKDQNLSNLENEFSKNKIFY